VIPSKTEDHGERGAAFTRLFQAEFAYVWASLRRLGVSERDAEDLTHDTFLRVYDKLDLYDPARPIRPWLFGFAFRAASDYRRLVRHRVEVLKDGEDVPAGAPLAEEMLSKREDTELVSLALGSLDLEKRAVLVAYELDECPMKEFADAVQIPLHTAYSRLRTAREEFAAAVRRLQRRRGAS